jgi:hypothetical protein
VILDRTAPALNYAQTSVTESELNVGDEKKYTDVDGNEVSLGDIFTTWYTSQQVIELTGLKSTPGIAYALQSGRLHGYKLGTKRRGEWRIDPKSVERFKYYKR